MNLRKVFHVAVYEYRTNFRRWGYLLVTFGLPVFGALLLWGVQALKAHTDVGALVTGDLNKPIALADQAGLFPSDVGLPKPFVRVRDIAQAKTATRAGDYLALVVIPPGYAPGQKVTVFIGSGIAAGSKVLTELQALLLYAALQKVYSPEKARRLAEMPNVDLVLLGSSATSEENSNGRFAVGYALSFLFFIALFSSAGYLLQSVAKEKESHIMELLLSSLTSLELLWGKVLGLAALALTQVTVWLVSMWLLGTQAVSIFPRYDALQTVLAQARHPDPQLLVAVVIIMPLSYLTYGLLMAGLGSLGSNLRESQQFSAAISLIAALPFMVNFLFFLNPNGVVPRVLSYFPLTAPSAVLLRLASGQIPWWDLDAATLMIALGALLSLWAGVRLFRVGVLVSGKKPSWREVWRIVRNPA